MVKRTLEKLFPYIVFTLLGIAYVISYRAFVRTSPYSQPSLEAEAVQP